MNILPGMAIIPINKQSLLLNKAMRVLQSNLQLNMLIAIEVEPRYSNNRFYYTCPKKFFLSEILQEMNAFSIKLLSEGIKPRPDVLANDDALNKKYRATPCKAVLKRQDRYKLIKPLVENIENQQFLFDHQTRKDLINEYLKTNLSTPKKISFKKNIQQLIYQFFAEGGSVNALTPYFSLRGGRGKQRIQLNKLGRPNAPTKAGIKGQEGYLMQEDDKRICGFAFRNYLIRGETVGKAVRKMWRYFYTSELLNDQGIIYNKLLPKNLRPTCIQFVNWGSKISGLEVWQKEFNTQQLARLNRAILGSSNDAINSVGQLGAIDSTTTDTEFVSVTNRTKRIGLANRMLVVDSLYGYIAGFYMGLEAPSAATVKLALLNTMSDKTEWLKFLGLDDMDPSDWIPIRFGNHICDNTDVRNKINIKELSDLGIGLKYVPTHRSDLNAIVETAHHSLHRLIDHLLPGTTRGKRLQRGDERPDLKAIMTIMEGIRETTKAIHFYNTMPLEIPITLEMRSELVDKGLTINRLNLTRLAIQKGKIHVSLISRDQAISTLATPIQGTFTSKGVKLHRTDKSERAFIEPVRYISHHPAMISKFREAKINRRVAPTLYDATFHYDPYQPDAIYYQDIHSGELFKLDSESPDYEYKEYTIPDYLAAMQQDAVSRYFVDEVKEELRTSFEKDLESTVNHIQTLYDADLAKSPPITKSKISKEKKNNRQVERNSMSLSSASGNDINPLSDAFTNESNVPLKSQNLENSSILDSLIYGDLE